MSFSCHLESEKMKLEKKKVSDDQEGSFVINIDNLFPIITRDTKQNSSNTLQKTVSRKWYQCEGQEKITRLGDRVLGGGGDGRGGGDFSDWSLKVASRADYKVEKPIVLNVERVGTKKPIKTSEEAKQKIIASNRTSEIKCKKHNVQRPWISPRRVLLFCAALSSMGSIIVIYFTMYIAKFGGNESALLE